MSICSFVKHVFGNDEAFVSPLSKGFFLFKGIRIYHATVFAEDQYLALCRSPIGEHNLGITYSTIFGMMIGIHKEVDVSLHRNNCTQAYH